MGRVGLRMKCRSGLKVYCGQQRVDRSPRSWMATRELFLISAISVPDDRAINVLILGIESEEETSVTSSELFKGSRVIFVINFIPTFFLSFILFFVIVPLFSRCHSVPLRKIR